MSQKFKIQTIDNHIVVFEWKPCLIGNTGYAWVIKSVSPIGSKK